MKIKDLVPGTKFRLVYGKNNRHNELVHVRGIVDVQIVTRTWVKHKKRWHYEVRSPHALQVMIDRGVLRKA